MSILSLIYLLGIVLVVGLKTFTSNNPLVQSEGAKDITSYMVEMLILAIFWPVIVLMFIIVVILVLIGRYF